MIEVRNLQADEAFPSFMDDWMKKSTTMREWVWVAKDDGNPVGVVVGAPVHGLVYLARIRTSEGAPSTTVLALMRKCFADCKERGFFGFFTQLNPTLREESKLIGVIRSTGGKQLEDPLVMVAGGLDT